KRYLKYIDRVEKLKEFKNKFEQEVFKFEDISINNQIQFQKAGLRLLPNGFVDLNTREVFLNQEVANLDTPIHEFAHLYNRALKQNNPELYQRGIDLVNQELEKENKKVYFSGGNNNKSIRRSGVRYFTS